MVKETRINYNLEDNTLLSESTNYWACGLAREKNKYLEFGYELKQETKTFLLFYNKEETYETIVIISNLDSEV